MKLSVRLAFVIPALLAVAPASAEPAPKSPKPAIRYVTLDKMLKKFAEEARTQQASRPQPRAVVVPTR